MIPSELSLGKFFYFGKKWEFAFFVKRQFLQFLLQHSFGHQLSDKLLRKIQLKWGKNVKIHYSLFRWNFSQLFHFTQEISIKRFARAITNSDFTSQSIKPTEHKFEVQDTVGELHRISVIILVVGRSFDVLRSTIQCLLFFRLLCAKSETYIIAVRKVIWNWQQFELTA